MKIRQMCGGGTWRLADLKPRLTANGGAVIVDAIGVAIVLPEWGPTRAEVWDEASHDTAEWLANNPGPTGIPHDPPINPYESNWGPFTWRTHGAWRDRLYDRFGDPRCWWPRGHQPVRHVTAVRLPEPAVAIAHGFDGWSQRVEATESYLVCTRCKAVLG